MKWFSGKTYDVAAGRESRSAFIAQAAFWCCAFRFLTHELSLKVWGFHLNFGRVDAALLGAFLLPCLSLYFGRRLFPGPQPPATIISPVRPEEKLGG